jgi:branched-chain amino acid transport system permease protein
LNFLIFVLSSLVIYVGLTTLLHLQFGQAGIVNFGVVGFMGIGMYGVGILVVTFGLNYWLALILATALSGIVAYGFGRIILNLDPESQLVTTLAFATILLNLVISERWLTGGVVGLGTIPRPFSLGTNTERATFALIVFITALVMLYAHRIGSQPFGRLMLSIRDNERLARSLGKATFQKKLTFFAVTCAAMGFFGGLYAAVNQFLVPRMLLPGATFTIWIALLLGGQSSVLGGLVGVLLTVGLFDVVIETYVSVPQEYAQLIPDIKLVLYGLMLILVLMFRPEGAVGKKSRGSV